jgi:hypothetical protein
MVDEANRKRVPSLLIIYARIYEYEAGSWLRVPTAPGNHQGHSITFRIFHFPLDFLHPPPTRLICYNTNDTMANTAKPEGNVREIGDDERGLKERK